MMKCINETDLPGIGKKFSLDTQSGDKLVVVVHDDGRRELYHFLSDDPDESNYMVTLNDNEARCIASILGGMAYMPRALENVDVVLHDMVIEWYKMEPDSKSIGKSIGELEIRKKTGLTIMAIIESEHVKTINPGPQVIIPAGSTLVLMGERHQIKAGKELIASGMLN